MMSKVVLAAVSLYLAAEGYSLLTAPASLVREAMVKASKVGDDRATPAMSP